YRMSDDWLVSLPFFFSSRRRHTRFSRDWSSDVCSSDLSFRSAGQRCSALRVLCVQDDIAPRVLEMLAGAMLELKVGDPGLLATDVGPVIDEPARERLERHAARMTHEARLIQRLSLPDELRA